MQADEADAPPRSFWRRRRLTIALAAAGALLAIGAAALELLLDSGTTTSADRFYVPPDPLPPGPPGAVVRSAPAAGAPKGAKAYRLLYRSQSHTGRPAALSALLVVPDGPAPARGRNIVALAHGTIGVQPRCALSRGPRAAAAVPGLERFVRRGYAIVVPDLEGLGTPGTHPYLVGEAAARATLDAVRATDRFALAEASRRFVVWGVGQGGHTALWVGREAASYAAELELAGVAAGAPATDLRRLVQINRNTTFGRVVAAYMLATWSRVYPELRLDEVLTPAARRSVEQLSRLCLPADHGSLRAALGDREVTLAARARDPWDAQPWKRLLGANSPGGEPIPVPVVIAQGSIDGSVRPALTNAFAARLCEDGATVQLQVVRGVGHSDLGERAAPRIATWIGRRFAGRRAPSTC